MANLIDNTYFVNDIALPVDSIQYELNQKIAMYEPEILIRCFGFDMYRQFIAALAGTPDQKWLDLRDGKEFQVNSIYYKWHGLINANKESLIANYVWYQFTRHNQEYVASSGIKKQVSENSQFANPRNKQCLVYNQMCDWINEMDFFISNNIANYDTYKPTLIKKINSFNI